MQSHGLAKHFPQSSGVGNSTIENGGTFIQHMDPMAQTSTFEKHSDILIDFLVIDFEIFGRDLLWLFKFKRLSFSASFFVVPVVLHMFF